MKGIYFLLAVRITGVMYTHAQASSGSLRSLTRPQLTVYAPSGPSEEEIEGLGVGSTDSRSRQSYREI